MDERVAKLKTPKECAVFAKNAVERGHQDLALAARKRAVQLRAEGFGAISEVERECIEAVYAYEEVLSAKAGRRKYASRTWPMIKAMSPLICGTLHGVQNQGDGGAHEY